MKTIAAEREPGIPPGIRNCSASPCGGKATPSSLDPSMPPPGHILFCCDLNDAAELSTVLGGVIRGEYAYGFNFVAVECRGKSRGAILGYRNSVDYVLHVVL